MHLQLGALKVIPQSHNCMVRVSDKKYVHNNLSIKYNNNLLSFGPLKYLKALSCWGLQLCPQNPCMLLLLYHDKYI